MGKKNYGTKITGKCYRKKKYGEKGTGGKSTGQKIREKKYGLKKEKNNLKKMRTSQRTPPTNICVLLLRKKVREKKLRKTNYEKIVQKNKVRRKKYEEKNSKKSREFRTGPLTFTSGQACARYHFRQPLIIPPQM